MDKYLLDTHTLIWFAEDSNSLSSKSKGLICDLSNECSISIISLWEIAIKTNIGKLEFGISLENLETLLNQNDIQILSPQVADFTIYQKLPLLHKDPFDRILIAQAITNNLSIITKDASFAQYDVPVIW